MTYTPTPAGHEDAPVEQCVAVESDPEIEAFFAYVHSDAMSGFKREKGIEDTLRLFFGSRPRWPKSRLRAIIDDPRMPTPKNDPGRLREKYPLGYYLLRNLVPVALDVCADSVLDADADYGRHYPFDKLGNQPHRVLVDHMAHARSPTSSQHEFIGQQTNYTLCILTHDHRLDGLPRFAFGESVIVNLGSLDGTPYVGNIGSTSSIRWSHSWYVGCRPRVVVRFARNDGVKWDDAELLNRREVSEYVDALLEDCRDPWSLHERYGSTPGRAIHASLSDLLSESKEFQRRRMQEISVKRGRR